MQEVPIQEVMTKDIVTVNANAAVSEVAYIFRQHNFHHILVVNDAGSLEGVISRTDLDQTRSGITLFNNPKKEEYDEALFSSLLAAEIMTPNVLTCKPTESIRRAYEVFKTNKFRALPVVSQDNLVGIITPLDLLDHFFN